MKDSHAQSSEFFEISERDQRNNIWRLTIAQALACDAVLWVSFVPLVLTIIAFALFK